MSTGTMPSAVAAERPTWRAVAVPSEHGGWGLTGEPILLGLLLAFSWAGLAVGAAAMLAFLARTPLKLAVVDRRRGRDLERTSLARKVSFVEITILVTLGVAALVGGGWQWLVPVAIAAPLFGVELWFDVRSRGRRLVPELCGAVGMGAVASAIVVAGGGSNTLAAGVWLVLAARSVAAIPFIRTQIMRLRRGRVSTRSSDLAQLTALVFAGAAVAVDADMLIGSLGVLAIVVAQFTWVRRSPVPPAKVLGMRQMALGFALVAVTAIGVHP